MNPKYLQLAWVNTRERGIIRHNACIEACKQESKRLGRELSGNEQGDIHANLGSALFTADLVAAQQMTEKAMQRATEAQEKGKKVCKRCNGFGFIPGYAHVEGGRCFKCTNG